MTSSDRDPGDPGDPGGALAPRTVVLPRFIVDQPLGLGEAVKRVTRAVGIPPCTACDQRAARLDQWLRISPPTRRDDA